jgi:hypothetical protein
LRNRATRRLGLETGRSICAVQLAAVGNGRIFRLPIYTNTGP